MLQAASLFNQLLQHFPRTEFGSLVKKHQAERAAKGFTCWTQFVAMTFCQLAHADSLREICNGLACSEGKLVHLGITNAPNKSTLSYANEHRPAALFEDLFYTSLNRFRSQEGMGARKAKFRFKNKLLSLDSTTISLCLDSVPLGQVPPGQRGRQGACSLGPRRLPAVLRPDHRGQEERCSHRAVPGSQRRFHRGHRRGYCDYALFGKWDGRGVFFVTRLKDNAAYEVVDSAMGRCRATSWPMNSSASPAPSGQGLSPSNPACGGLDPINEREIVLLSNLLQFSHHHCRHLQGPLGN